MATAKPRPFQMGLAAAASTNNCVPIPDVSPHPQDPKLWLSHLRHFGIPHTHFNSQEKKN